MTETEAPAPAPAEPDAAPASPEPATVTAGEAAVFFNAADWCIDDLRSFAGRSALAYALSAIDDYSGLTRPSDDLLVDAVKGDAVNSDDARLIVVVACIAVGAALRASGREVSAERAYKLARAIFPEDAGMYAAIQRFVRLHSPRPDVVCVDARRTIAELLADVRR